jgi:hypothetical protein
MVIFISILCGLFLWMLYEVWRAPVVEEGPGDSIKSVGPTKRLRDIFKK